MIIAALTGGIATGKSTVAAMFAEQGAVIIDADQAAHAVMEPGQPAYLAVVERFGVSVLAPDGHVDRARLGDLIFGDPALRRELDRIVHPHVFRQMAAAANSAGQGALERIVILDIPLLIESGRQHHFETVIVVFTSSEQQLKRLMTRNGLAREKALVRIQSQLPIETKRTYATHLIDNSGPPAATQAQVVRMMGRLKQNGRPISKLIWQDDGV